MSTRYCTLYRLVNIDKMGKLWAEQACTHDECAFGPSARGRTTLTCGRAHGAGAMQRNGGGVACTRRTCIVDQAQELPRELHDLTNFMRAWAYS